jgi:hypothetical protein
MRNNTVPSLGDVKARVTRVSSLRYAVGGMVCLLMWWVYSSPESLATAGVIFTASFNTNVLGEEWTTQVQRLSQDSTVTASEGQLTIRTDGGCYTNAAAVEAGHVSGQIRLAYEWEAAASGWWEVPKTTVYEDAIPVWETSHPPCPGDQTIPDGETSGLDDQVLTVDGDLRLEFAVTPSQHCGADDHEWTEYTIHNIVIETVQ